MDRCHEVPGLPAVLAVLAVAIVATTAAAAGCVRPGRCDGMMCSATCPRDSERDSSGRCACAAGTFLVLGACVPAPVGDAFCGPAAILDANGCAFRPCGPEEQLDLVTGRCAGRRTVKDARVTAGQGCGTSAWPIVAGGQIECAPADATCPRGARRSDANTCTRPPRCPPGTVADVADLGDAGAAGACRLVVTAGGHLDDRRVDVGAWMAVVLGVDGGRGSREVCQPLQQRAMALGLERGEALEVGVAVSLVVPDQDVPRLHADVRIELHPAGGPGGVRPPPAGVQELVSDDVSTLLEALRGLGGESSAAAIDLHVSCVIGGW
jgi:hypothetical protein